MQGMESGLTVDGLAPPSAIPFRRAGSGAGLVVLYSGTLVLAALLLFSLQPMFAKRVLPILGGSPGVWSVATVVFQALLLAGYAYAHVLTRSLRLQTAMAVHGLVLLAGLVSLPVGIAAGFSAPPADAEALWLVGLFLASIGLPFFALSASAPLLQAWFARSGHDAADDPYFLYRASNAGSFAALLAYPLLVEPMLGLESQSSVWSAGYGLLACAMAACALGVSRTRSTTRLPVARSEPAPATSRRLAWIGLSAVPSGLLVAATAHVSTDVAAIPLLWIFPLALYLLSFVVAYRPGHAWPARTLAALQVAGTIAALIAVMLAPAPLAFDLAVTMALLFVNALIAHRAVRDLRPGASRLTEFYLCTAFGGMLGGLFAGLVAPLLFAGVHEYPILLAAALLCRPGLLPRGRAGWIAEGSRPLALTLGIALIVAVAASLQGAAIATSLTLALLAIAMAANWGKPLGAALFGLLLALASILLPILVRADMTGHRSFFGVHRVQTSPDGRFRLLLHGTTVHGAMRLRDDQGAAVSGPPEPTTYYFAGGPLADVLEVARRAGGALPAVSVVGLGSGSLACHARAGEAWTFYEIDPMVIRLASDPQTFRFLRDCAPNAGIVQGDARLTLAGKPHASRVLIVDAFSSDAIPMHLLTGEALDLDLAHLDARGVLAFHITNRHFELRHVLARLAAERGLTLLYRYDPQREPVEQRLRAHSAVALMTRDPAAKDAALALGWRPVTPDLSRRPWSDDYANAIEAMIDRMRAPLVAD